MSPICEKQAKNNHIYVYFLMFSTTGLDVQGKKQTKRDRPSDDTTERPDMKKRKPRTNYAEDEENSMDNEDPFATDEDTDFSLDDLSLEDQSDDPLPDDSDSD